VKRINSDSNEWLKGTVGVRDTLEEMVQELFEVGEDNLEISKKYDMTQWFKDEESPRTAYRNWMIGTYFPNGGVEASDVNKYWHSEEPAERVVLHWTTAESLDPVVNRFLYSEDYACTNYLVHKDNVVYQFVEPGYATLNVDSVASNVEWNSAKTVSIEISGTYVDTNENGYPDATDGSTINEQQVKI